MIAAAIAGIYNGATHRANIYDRWDRERIGAIIAGLDEHAANAIKNLLRTVQRDYGIISSEDFWPNAPPPDPATYMPYIKAYTKAQRYKDGIERDVKRLMSLGRIMVTNLTLLIIGTTLVIVHFTVDFDTNVVEYLGYGMSALAATVISWALYSHVTINDRLVSAEMLSDE